LARAQSRTAPQTADQRPASIAAGHGSLLGLSGDAQRVVAATISLVSSSSRLAT